MAKVILLALFIGQAQALQLFLEGEYPQKDKAAIQEFIAQTIAKVPEKIKNSIPWGVGVKFKRLDAYAEPITPPCPRDLKDYKQACQVYSKGSPIYGQIGRSSKRIFLNANLLPYIIAGDRGEEFPCRLKSFYRMAAGALIHELTHIYDRDSELSNCDEKTLTLLKRCRNGEQAPHCDSLVSKYKRTYTDRQQLKFLSGWSKNWRFSKRQQVNVLSNRATTPHARKNFKETFAVNLSYWLLDPEFSRRRPALNSYFENFFAHSAFPRQEPRNEIFVIKNSFKGAKLTRIALDPKRIAGVHILNASPGKDISSAFGHTMLRIVTCAPGRPVGPDCIKDLDHHLVLNVYADVGYQLNYLDVLKGKYQASASFNTLREVIEEYTAKEMRDLSSEPLDLNSQEIEVFIYSLLEDIYSKYVPYDYYSQNCATRVLSLLKGAVLNKKLQKIYSIAPVKLAKALRDIKLASPSLGKKYYFFPSAKAELKESFRHVKIRLEKHCPGPLWKSYDTYIENTASRHRCISKYGDRAFPHKLYFLERFAMRRANHAILERLQSLMQASNVLETFVELQRGTREPSFSFNSYGIPDEAPDFDGLNAEFKKIQLQAYNLLKLQAPELIDNLKEISIVTFDLAKAALKFET